MIVQVEIPDEALSELAQALEEASRYARGRGEQEPLRATGRPTRRYDWFSAAFALGGIVTELRLTARGRRTQ